MDLRLHPCSVDPAEGSEKCWPSRSTRSGFSCNNATVRFADAIRRGLVEIRDLDLRLDYPRVPASLTLAVLVL